MGGSDTVTEIKTAAQFDEVINGDKPVVIDFWAEWCGPCKMISPIFEKLSKDNDKVGFYKVDNDDDALASVIEREGIKALPTFLFYHKGVRKQETKGANPTGLNTLIKQASESI